MYSGYTWEAIATIIHTGDRPTSGHYYTYVRQARGTGWWKFEDSSSPEGVTLNPYLRDHNLFLFKKTGRYSSASTDSKVKKK